jgi:hypothetical protein
MPALCCACVHVQRRIGAWIGGRSVTRRCADACLRSHMCTAAAFLWFLVSSKLDNVQLCNVQVHSYEYTVGRRELLFCNALHFKHCVVI